jgi:hypothetical protein
LGVIWTRRKFLGRGLVAGLSLLGLDQAWEANKIHWPGADIWCDGPEPLVCLPIAEASEIRLLQFTDLHFGRGPLSRRIDALTRDDLLGLVDRFEPHLVLITGDLWHNNPLHCGTRILHQSLAVMEELGSPWLFTWGNHDRLDDYVAGHQALTAAPQSLYRGGREGGNYTVQLRDRSGRPLWDLFCLNSMQIGLSQDQRDWLAQERERQRRRPSAAHAFAVFHIPLKQFDDAWTVARGVRLEQVSHEGEDGSTLAYLQAMQTVRACLVGHDHVNDYATRAGGIDLIYGRASGYGGYGEHSLPKGAKLYRLNAETGAYHWTSVRARGLDWEPRKRHEEWKWDLWG